MWTELPTPILIAHRGFSIRAPENTLSAFILAADCGADAIELDVKLSRDGRVVVIHDQTVDRTTDGSGDVGTFSLEGIKELQITSSFGENFPGEKIPTLEEVFETVGSRIHLNIELTNYKTPGDDLVPKVCSLITEYNVQDKVLLSSFFPANLKKAHKFLPDIPCGLLAWKGWMGLPTRIWGWRNLTYFSCHPYYSDVDTDLIISLHEAQKRIFVWTVNEKIMLEQLIHMGIDGIFTDDPDAFLEVVRR